MKYELTCLNKHNRLLVPACNIVNWPTNYCHQKIFVCRKMFGPECYWGSNSWEIEIIKTWGWNQMMQSIGLMYVAFIWPKEFLTRNRILILSLCSLCDIMTCCNNQIMFMCCGWPYISLMSFFTHWQNTYGERVGLFAQNTQLNDLDAKFYSSNTGNNQPWNTEVQSVISKNTFIILRFWGFHRVSEVSEIVICDNYSNDLYGRL
jgi:hypothetical protein